MAHQSRDQRVRQDRQERLRVLCAGGEGAPGGRDLMLEPAHDRVELEQIDCGLLRHEVQGAGSQGLEEESVRERAYP